MNDNKENQWEPRRVSDQKRAHNEYADAWRDTLENDELGIWDASEDEYTTVEILPEDDEPSAWDRWCALVFKALRNPATPLPDSVLKLAVPQDACCFSFGANRDPLPAGALRRLWEMDPAATGVCPLCGGEVVAVAFGGLLSIGGYPGRCLGCAAPMFKWIGGLGAVHSHVSPYLEGTPWFVNGSTYGGASTGDGKALAKALNLPKRPRHKIESKVTLKVGKHTLPSTPITIGKKD